MEIIQTEDYEVLGAELQFQMIEILNEALKKHGITQDLRKEICGDFTFDFSMLLDQGEINDMIPTVAFIKNDKLLVKNEEFEFHEYAFGNVDEVFI
jgi:hypothetical protein